MIPIKQTIIGIFGLSILLGCAENTKTNRDISNLDLNGIVTKNYSEYSDTIILIENRIGDLTAPSDLFGVDEFLKIFENSKEYYKVAERFLSDTNFTLQQRQISLLSMQKPDLIINYNISRLCCDLHKKELIDDYFLIFSIFPPEIHNYELIRNYKLPEIQSLFEEIHDILITEEYKETIETALKGDSWENKKRYLKAIGHKYE